MVFISDNALTNQVRMCALYKYHALLVIFYILESALGISAHFS